MSDGAVRTIEKSVRYDRGIRIWGNEGQSALEEATVCLLNCSATGAEALKNLVLGGINAFTIVDDAHVSSIDLGNNFMVYPSSLGKPRAQVVTETLKELNELVNGSFVEDTAGNIIENNPCFFKSYTLVIATQISERDALALDAICRESGIPLILARSYGLVGMLRTCLNEHCIVDTKPENVVQDFRFGNPWVALRELASTVDFQTLDAAAHGHIPYGILLVKATEEWMRRYPNKALPSTFSERQEYKDIIKSWQLKVDDCPIPEENFDEALLNVTKVWSPKPLPSDIARILEDEKVNTIDTSSESFWIICAALRRFVRETGHLPVHPSIPDMHSSTSSYLKLQQVYQEKFNTEVSRIHAYCQDILKHIGIDATTITVGMVQKVCLHCRSLRVIRPKRLYPLSEIETPKALKQGIDCESERYSATIYITLRCIDAFYEQHARFPGSGDSVDTEEDSILLKQIIASCTGDLFTRISSEISDDMLCEIVRSGGEELHCIAAILGAMASQEAVKLLTCQLVPVSGTLIYDGINCTSTVLDIN